MGLPKDNKKGYRDGSSIHYAKQFKGNLLLVHGTSIDRSRWAPLLPHLTDNLPEELAFDVLLDQVEQSAVSPPPVEERDDAGLLALLGPTDSFDSRALVHGQGGHGRGSRSRQAILPGLPQARPALRP